MFILNPDSVIQLIFHIKRQHLKMEYRDKIIQILQHGSFNTMSLFFLVLIINIMTHRMGYQLQVIHLH